MQNSATFDKTVLPQFTKSNTFWLHVNANVKRTEFIICYSIPVIQYIVFLRLIYEENVCLFPQVRCTVCVEVQKVAMFWFCVHDTYH